MSHRGPSMTGFRVSFKSQRYTLHPCLDPLGVIGFHKKIACLKTYGFRGFWNSDDLRKSGLGFGVSMEYLTGFGGIFSFRFRV